MVFIGIRDDGVWLNLVGNDKVFLVSARTSGST